MEASISLAAGATTCGLKGSPILFSCSSFSSLAPKEGKSKSPKTEPKSTSSKRFSFSFSDNGCGCCCCCGGGERRRGSLEPRGSLLALGSRFILAKPKSSAAIWSFWQAKSLPASSSSATMASLVGSLSSSSEEYQAEGSFT